MIRAVAALCGVVAMLSAVPAAAEDGDEDEAPSFRQSADDAWWTGPMLANSAATLPRGRALMETYLFDRMQGGSSTIGTLTYLIYGVTDRISIGMQPMFGVRTNGATTSGPGVGDLTLSVQYRVTSPKARAGRPTISVSLRHSLPIGRYDRLDTRPAISLGGGNHTTTLALYGQQYFWLPNGQIFRGRINLSRTFAGKAAVSGESVYGTKAGFRGQAWPGNSIDVGVSGEYSVSRRFALALDLTYNRSGSTRVTGVDGAVPVDVRSGASVGVAIAPGVEYSWRSNIGVLLAMRIAPRGRNSGRSMTPAVAINYVF